MQTMADLGVTGILEVPPAGTLTVIKRALKGVETFALKTPDQLEDARDLRRHSTEPAAIDASPTWRLLVAPCQGHVPLRATPREIGDSVEPARPWSADGQQPARRAPVIAPHGGTVVEWLVEDGDPVPPANLWSGCTPRRSTRDPTAITPRPARRTHAILGVGGYRPSRVVTNAEICEHIDSSDEWIRDPVGDRRATLGRGGRDRRRRCPSQPPRRH